MTENDYIAEYIKEKYPSLLGFDFGIWKTCRVIWNAVGQIGDILKTIPTDKLKKIMRDAEDETEPETDEEGDMEVTKDHPRYKEFEGDYFDKTIEVEYTPKFRKS